MYLTKLQPTKKSTPNNRLLLEDIFDSLLHITAAPFPHGRKLLEHTPIRLHPPVATKGVQILASTRFLREVRDGFSFEGNLNKMDKLSPWWLFKGLSTGWGWPSQSNVYKKNPGWWFLVKVHSIGLTYAGDGRQSLAGRPANFDQ